MHYKPLHDGGWVVTHEDIAVPADQVADVIRTLPGEKALLPEPMMETAPH